MGWPPRTTLVPRLPDLLRYQHHYCWNTSKWELILHSLHHLYHLHYKLRLAVRSTGPPGVCQNWLSHKHWVRTYLFFFPLVTFFLFVSVIFYTIGLTKTQNVSMRSNNQLNLYWDNWCYSSIQPTLSNPLTPGTFLRLKHSFFTFLFKTLFTKLYLSLYCLF